MKKNICERIGWLFRLLDFVVTKTFVLRPAGLTFLKVIARKTVMVWARSLHFGRIVIQQLWMEVTIYFVHMLSMWLEPLYLICLKWIEALLEIGMFCVGILEALMQEKMGCHQDKVTEAKCNIICFHETKESFYIQYIMQQSPDYSDTKLLLFFPLCLLRSLYCALAPLNCLVVAFK